MNCVAVILLNSRVFKSRNWRKKFSVPLSAILDYHSFSKTIVFTIKVYIFLLFFLFAFTDEKLMKLRSISVHCWMKKRFLYAQFVDIIHWLRYKRDICNYGSIKIVVMNLDIKFFNITILYSCCNLFKSKNRKTYFQKLLHTNIEFKFHPVSGHLIQASKMKRKWCKPVEKNAAIEVSHFTNKNKQINFKI